MQMRWLKVPHELRIDKLELLYMWTRLGKVREDTNTAWAWGTLHKAYSTIVTIEDDIYKSLRGVNPESPLAVVVYGYKVLLEPVYCGIPGYDSCEEPCLVLSGITRQREGDKLLQVVFGFRRVGTHWRAYVGTPSASMMVITREFTPGASMPTGRELMQVFAQGLARRS